MGVRRPSSSLLFRFALLVLASFPRQPPTYERRFFSRTYLFCAIRPEVKYHPYTFSTCNFAKNASVVKLQPKKAVAFSSPAERKLMDELEQMKVGWTVKRSRVVYHIIARWVAAGPGLSALFEKAFSKGFPPLLGYSDVHPDTCCGSSSV